MAEREPVHKLGDGLPDEAVPHVLRMLERMQQWPPPPEMQRMRDEMQRRGLDRFPGAAGGGVGGWVGGGGVSLSSLGDVRNGHFSSSHIEGTDQVVDTRRFHEGHELQIRERFRLAKEGKSLIYSQETAGLKRQVSHEVEFEIDEAGSAGGRG